MVDDQLVRVFIQSEVELIVIHWITADEQFQIISESSKVNEAFLKIRCAHGTGAVLRDCTGNLCGGWSR